MHADRQRSHRPAILALAGGLVTTGLLWRATPGLSWLVLVGAFALVCLRFLGGRRPTGLALAWATAAVFAAACLCWRASTWTLAVALPTSFAFAASLPIVVRRRLTWRELADLPAFVIAWLCGGRVALVDARTWLRPVDGRTSRRVLVGVAVGGPLALVTALLLAANPGFSDLARELWRELGSVAGFAAWWACATVVLALGWLALDRMHCGVLERLRAMALLGHVDVQHDPAPVNGSPYREIEARERTITRVPRALPALTWAIVLAQLVCVFGLYVVANLRDLFGGHDLVRDVGTATYAEHLHAGFMSVTAATVLGVATVMFGHRVTASPKGRAAAGLLSALEAVLLLLTAVTLASCWQRTTIYMEAYGYTHQRLGVVFVQLAVLAVLATTFLRAIFRGWQGHRSGVGVVLALLSLGASAFDADLFIARANLRRLVEAPPTATSSGLDIAYLEQLGVDALPALDDEHVPAELAGWLEQVWSERAELHSCGDWRGFRGLGPALSRSGSRPSPRSSCSPSSSSF